MLLDHGPRDVAGLPARPLFEVVLVGYLLLYGEEEGWNAVGGDHAYWVKKMAREGHFSGLKIEWAADIEPKQLYVTKLLSDVKKLLTAHGDATAGASLDSAYFVLYRGASMMEIHGNFQSIAGYVVDKGARWDLQPERRDAGVNLGSVIFGAAFLGAYASHVLDVFGFTTSVDHLTELTGALNPDTRAARN